MTGWKRLVILGAGSLLFAGCARSESCERGRMTLDKMWETAQTQAAQVKLAQADQGTSPSSVWPAIESDLELLQSAFATEQVTWESAKKKATQLQQAIQDLGAPTSSTMQSLRDSVTKATSMQGDLEKSCRF